jgi:glyoxylate reductase
MVLLPDTVLELIKKEHVLESNTEQKPLEREKLLSSIIDKHVLLSTVTNRIDEELLDKARNLKVIANCAVGFDNIDIPAATQRKIPVTNTPGVLTDTTADLAFALILATGRRLVEGDRMVREGRFKYVTPSGFLGQDISGKVLGILGLGRIGKAVAKRAAGFNMKVIYFNRNKLSQEDEQAVGAQFVDFETLLKTSDFVSIHVPLTPDTRHMLSTTQLKLMKPSAYLINTSRGPVVDEEALVMALRDKKIKGAGLDVYEKEPTLTPGLKELENVILLPHVGSASVETRTKMAYMAAENLLAVLNGEIPPNCLNGQALYGDRKMV